MLNEPRVIKVTMVRQIGWWVKPMVYGTLCAVVWIGLKAYTVSILIGLGLLSGLLFWYSTALYTKFMVVYNDATLLAALLKPNGTFIDNDGLSTPRKEKP